MRIITTFLRLLLCMIPAFCQAQTVMPLYTSEMPDAKPAVDEGEVRPNKHLDTIVVNVSVPTLTAFLPSADKAPVRR